MHTLNCLENHSLHGLNDTIQFQHLIEWFVRTRPQPPLDMSQNIQQSRGNVHQLRVHLIKTRVQQNSWNRELDVHH